jgi:hypothetical protein
MKPCSFKKIVNSFTAVCFTNNDCVEFFFPFFRYLVINHHLSIVGAKVVIVVVGALTCGKVNVKVGDLGNETTLHASTVSGFDIFTDNIDLGTIGTSDDRHLLDASTHGCTRNFPDITTLREMIVEAHIEQIVSLNPADGSVASSAHANP